MLPLAHRTLLITRAASQVSSFSDLLQAQGAEVIEMPTLEIGPPSSWAALDGAIARLAEFDWLILTSANGVEFFFERLQTHLSRLAEGSPANLRGLKLAVVGKKTAAVLRQYGYRPDFVPPDFVADSLVEHFPDPLSGLNLLFPRVESGGRDLLVNAFRTAGARVEEVAAYESGCPQVADAAALAALQSGSVAAITFASSKTVRHFVQLLQGGWGEAWLNALTGVAIASIGPQTSTECRQQFGRVDIEATEYTLEGLTAAIVDYFASV